MSEQKSPSVKAPLLTTDKQSGDRSGDQPANPSSDNSDIVGDPWDQLPEETPKAFDAFQIYLSMPPAERSVVAAYNLEKQSLGKGQANPAKQASGTWNYWAAAFKWQDRAKAYDRHMVAIERQEQEKQRRRQVREREQEQIERLREYREQVHDLSAATLGTSILLLDKLTERIGMISKEELASLPLSALGNLVRTVTVAAKVAMDAQAQVLAVDQILDHIDAENAENALASGDDDDGAEDEAED